MFKLLMIHSDKFRMVDQKSNIIVEGSWNKVQSFCEFEGFHDLELALEVMTLNNHNLAEFGIGKCFLFSKNNAQMPRLALVS